MTTLQGLTQILSKNYSVWPNKYQYLVIKRQPPHF